MITFRHVQKSPLIIGIVDRIKINYSKQVRAVPYFLQIARFTIFYICFVHFHGNRSSIDKSSSSTCLLDSDVVKGDPDPTWLRKYQEEDEEEAVERAIKESEIFVSSIFYNFFVFFLSITLLYFFYTFFTHAPHLRLLPTTQDPRHLATLEENE